MDWVMKNGQGTPTHAGGRLAPTQVVWALTTRPCNHYPGSSFSWFSDRVVDSFPPCEAGAVSVQPRRRKGTAAPCPKVGDS